ncbi:MAG TPA: bifunctional precorrin-2 dehydrogenase/sirohydrochlorin ferrochelatase [Phycisphaerae bacterium]|nr:bifunctional precorrin-2 dehydrogenase/sirohydrochlorin ferrochelatase [Phycisphaerae bacterium]HPS52768.1 bifunctional precorrin-2 dehydrogenase/sirohydrochlorin ferrochelatase [Phycisphaerae bacterium]
MKTYPAMLNLSGRLVAVIGAGTTGLRKVRSLCDAGAKVRLIAGKNFNPGCELPDDVEVLAEDFDSKTSTRLLEDCRLIFACCNDRKTNSEIAAVSRKLGIWVNVADQPEDCDFFCPAVLCNGDVTIAIGTGGNAPGLSAELKKFISRNLPADTGRFAESLSHLRAELKNSCHDPSARQAAMKKLSSEEGYAAFASRGEHGLREMLSGLQGGN